MFSQHQSPVCGPSSEFGSMASESVDIGGWNPVIPPVFMILQLWELGLEELVTRSQHSSDSNLLWMCGFQHFCNPRCRDYEIQHFLIVGFIQSTNIH